MTIFKRLVAIFMGLLLIIPIGEFVCRVRKSSNRRAIEAISITPSLHPPLPYELRPNTSATINSPGVGKLRYSINAFGLRTEPFSSLKNIDEKRILILGSSVAFGLGVSGADTFSGQLQTRLRTRHPKIQTMNAAFINYNLWDELNWLKIHGYSLKPDVIVVDLFLNAHIAKAGASATGGTDYRQRFSWSRRLASFVFDRSIFLCAVKDQLKRGYWRAHSDEYRQKLLVLMGGRSDWMAAIDRYCDRKSYALSDVNQAVPFHQLFDQVAWQGIRPVLDEYRLISRRRHIPILFVIAPMEFQLDPVFGDASPQAEIKALLREYGFNPIDVLPLFRDWSLKNPGSSLYDIKGDYVHFNRQGHRLVAEAIAAELERSSVLDLRDNR